jgi:hypothetical protein
MISGLPYLAMASFRASTIAGRRLRGNLPRGQKSASILFDKRQLKALRLGNPPETKGMRKPNFLGKISEEIQMKMTRYSEPQILAILRQAEGGVPVSELCREHGMH